MSRIFTVMVAAALVAAGQDTPTRDAPGSGDWPQWRGPDRDGLCRETGLLPTWPEAGPPLAWKIKNCGEGYSTPTVAGGLIYGMGNRGGDEIVWALDEATGTEKWSAPIGPKPPRAGGGYEGPRCSPTVDDGRVFAVGISGDLVCLDAKSGNQLWKASYKSDFAGVMMSGWGFSESPYVDGDRLIVTPGGSKAALVALDKKTGKVIWKSAADGGGAGYSSVVAANVGNRKIYLTWMRSALVGVDAADGKQLFKYGKIANSTANIPTVVVRGEHVFASTGYGDGGSALLKLTAKGNGVDVVEVWHKTAKELQNHHGGFVLVGDHLYFGHGHNKGYPVCVEFLTGKVVWQKDRGPGEGSAAVLYAEGNLYFRYQNGVIALIAADPKSYDLKSKFTQPDQSKKPTWPHPVIAHGKMYVRDQDVLLCYDVKKK